MLIKKYVVSDMNEAMTRIRYELGTDAVIISQRRIRKKGIQGLFAKKLIEVTAAKDNSYQKDKEDKVFNTKAIEEIINKELIQKKDTEKGKESINVEKDIYDDVKEMKCLLNKLIDNSKEDDCSLKSILKNHDVIDEVIEKLLQTDIEDKEILKKRIKDIVKIENKELKGKTVIVGPTGVGKTTTIAKIAGRLSLIENKTVGLITIDTYRIGAVEQLKTYAEIMNIPFKVVITLKEMEEAIDELKDVDVLLIDTTGRSSKNKMQISELRAFVEKVQADNISLVLSATTKNNDLKSIIDGYKTLGYEDIIISKLDETVAYGTIINIAYLSDKPIRFLTTGQNVPNDIEKCSKEDVINRILGEEVLC